MNSVALKRDRTRTDKFSRPAPFDARVASRLVKDHVWPIAGAFAILIIGLAFSFEWDPLVQHLNEWITPADLWATFRDAHYVGWGSEEEIYSAHTGLVTFPGIAVLLTPLAMLQNPLHLSSSIPWYLVRPTMWYLLGPVDLLLGGFLLFPLDALAKYFHSSTRRRGVLVSIEALLILPVVAYWGHPEDTVAVGLALYGVLATFHGKWLRAGFLLGLAVAFQPLVLLVLPIAFALTPLRYWPPVISEVVLPSAMLLLAPLIRDWGPTTSALLKQPNEPSLDHPTPWLALAPRLPVEHYASNFSVQQTPLLGGGGAVIQHNTGEGAIHLVAAGPQRALALLVAVAIGGLLLRRRPNVLLAVWWIAVALSLRCVFESVMTPYYLLPALVVALLVAFQQVWWRTAFAVLLALFCSVVSYLYMGEWAYYALVIGSLLVTLALSYPNERVAAATSLTVPFRTKALEPPDARTEARKL